MQFRRRTARPAQRSGLKLSARGPGASSAAPGQSDAGRNALYALGPGKPSGGELVGGEAMEVVAERHHEVPFLHHRRSEIDPAADEKSSTSSLQEDAFLLTGPVANQPHTAAP